MSSRYPIRVLHLGSPMGLYGAERWILALVKHLDSNTIESHVTAIKDAPEIDPPLCREAANLGFKAHIFQAHGQANFAAVRLLRKYILQEKIDILHTHFYKTDIIGLLATRGTGCKIITTPHGWSNKVGLKLLAYEMLDRCIFPLMDGIVPLSDDLLRPLRGIPGLCKKLHLIRNGVDISEIDAVAHASPEGNAWKSNSEFVIGYIGQLISRKGLHVLFRAAARLDIPWRLIIVGEGPEQEKFVTLAQELGIKNKVEFLGFRPDRIGLLKGFDLFVLPSNLEGIPRCLMEAMAARVPVVASDIPGCRDLVKHGQNGLLFPMDDEYALAAAIKKMATQEKLSETLVTNARHTVSHKYSASRMALEYTTLYRELISQ